MSITPIKIYEILLDHFGKQDWWPVQENYHKEQGSDPRFEIIVGAILTQNTAWVNVEKALFNLREKQSLTIKKFVETDIEDLKTMIQPSGFFNQKAKRLKIFASHIHDKYEDDLGEFFIGGLKEIRNELLSLNGIGPETADSILLYAGNHPIFVVDAYTKRICERIPLKLIIYSYDEIQQYFQDELNKIFPEKETVQMYKELHALIVELAKNYCNKRPKCYKCVLRDHCEFNPIKTK